MQFDDLHGAVLVRTPARAGSTLMMQLLASAPTIAFDRKYPYEVRHLSYLIRAAHVISVPFNRKADALPFDWDQRLLAQTDLKYVGPLPAKSALLDPERRRRSTSEALFRAFSAELRESVPGSTYYAEKVAAADIVRRVAELTTTKVIYGIRDPRDQMVSIMDFNRKRGTMRFGWQSDDDQLSYAKQLCERTKRYLKNVDSAAKSPNQDSIVVRYEDLIQEPRMTIDRLSSWLGVELDDQVVREQRERIGQRHATSSSPEQSIGRWNGELEPSVKELFQQELGGHLRAMGWE